MRPRNSLAVHARCATSSALEDRQQRVERLRRPAGCRAWRVMRVATGWREACSARRALDGGSRSLSSTMPTSRPSSSTGSCETSAAACGCRRSSSVSSGPTVDRAALVAARRSGRAGRRDAAARGSPGRPSRVVVDLREVLRAAVADEGHDALRLGLLAAIAQRRGEQRAGRRAAQDAFLAQQQRARSRCSRCR